MNNNLSGNFEYFVIDFGGVLYDISHELTFTEFYKLAGNKDNFTSYSINDYLNDELIIQFEKGLIEPVEFRLKVKEKFLIIADNHKFDEAFNATLIKLKPDAINNIKKLKRFGKIYLLSNTNKIHYDHFKNECKELFELFDGLFFSFLNGKRKPERMFFEYLIQNSGLQPQVSLFIDDSIENINAGKKSGFNTLLINEKKSLSDFIHDVENFT